MLLSEAAKTGRLFKRKSEPAAWYQLEGMNMVRVLTGESVAITAEMLISNDWEPEPLKMELTADDIIRYARPIEDLASKRRLSAVEFARLLHRAGAFGGTKLVQYFSHQTQAGLSVPGKSSPPGCWLNYGGLICDGVIAGELAQEHSIS